MRSSRLARWTAPLLVVGVLTVSCSTGAPGTSPPAPPVQATPTAQAIPTPEPAATQQPTATAEAPPTESPPEAVQVRFSFDWKPDGDWAPVLWAEENGYFDEEGVQVEFVLGDGSSAVLPLLAQGSFDLAQLSAPPVVLSAEQEIPMTVVGVPMPDSPNVIIADGSIETPEDVKGRRVGLQVGEFEEALWEAWFKANGIDRSEIDEVPIADIGADVLFIDHQVDVILDFYTSGVIPSLTEGREGEETLFPIRDTLDVVGHTLAANEDFLAQQPDAVRAFLTAWARGMEYTVDHPDESVELILSRYPENDRTATEWSVARYVEAWVTDQARAEGYLSFTPEMFEATKQVLIDGGLMPDVDISGLYDTSYLPSPPVTP